MTEARVVTLHGSPGYPAAIANIAEVSAGPHGGFGFGISKKTAAAALRELADAIESGAALAQKVSHSTHATVEDFVMHHVTVVFAATRPEK